MADLSPQQVSELLESRGDVQLIDVREPDEHAAGRIAGARLIPLGELTAAADSLRRDVPLVFVCRSGARSAMATEAFAAPATRRSTSRAASRPGRPPASPSSPRTAT